jgi:hypothetical protein
MVCTKKNDTRISQLWYPNKFSRLNIDFITNYVDFANIIGTSILSCERFQLMTYFSIVGTS